jgi:putative membrane protein
VHGAAAHGEETTSEILRKVCKKMKNTEGRAMNERIIKIAHVVAVGVFLLVAIIATAQAMQNSNQSGGQAAATKQATALNSADRRFVMEAAMGGMTEVELGRLAAERGSSDAVKQFGQRMVGDHSRANGELMQLVSGKGITLPTALDAKHQAMVAKMSRLSGAAFDRAYAKEMVKDHNKTVALFQREATGGADADLNAFAQKTLPTLQEHLSMARALPNGSGNASTHGNMNQSTQK